jgi:hypothetical protein
MFAILLLLGIVDEGKIGLNWQLLLFIILFAGWVLPYVLGILLAKIDKKIDKTNYGR